MGAMTAKSSFGDGLIMDFAPDNTQATNLTNALNATLVTMNGNELSLQNDMGNGRVETAQLPKGYVPVGTCEFGDIIYIVSYNPLINKSQIGCFPSPERNLDSQELNSEDTILDTEELGKTPIYKVLIQSTKLNPGDKYIVTGDFSGISSQLSDYGNTSHIKGTFPRTIRLSVVSIEDSGKINYLDTDVKWYDDYYLLNNKDANGQSVDIDSYQNAVSSAYSVFSSKVSGKLAILAEYETIKSFSCSQSIYTVDVKQDNGTIAKEYHLYLNTSWETDNNDVNPIGVKAIEFPEDIKDIGYTGDYFINSDCDYENFTKTCYNTKVKEYETISNPILQIKSSLPKEGYYIVGNSEVEIKDIIINNYFKKDVTKCLYVFKKKPESIITYKVAPCMPELTLDNMAVSNTIDFSKIGTGTINITQWRYFKQDNLLTLTFALEVYEEPNKGISKIDLDFFNSEKNLGTLSLTNKSSYFGTFTYTIPLDTTNTYFNGILESNLLYGVNINIYYQDKNSLGGYDTISNPTIVFNRFIWTNGMYNNYYYNTSDFDELNVQLDIATEQVFNANLNIAEDTDLHTSYLEDKDSDLIPYYSLSYTKQSITKQPVTLKISPTFKNNYGTFQFNNNITNEYIKVKCTNKNITVTDTSVISDNPNYNDISLIKPLIGDSDSKSYPSNDLTKDSLTEWAGTLNDSFDLVFKDATEKEITIQEAIDGIPLVMNGIFYSKALFSTFNNGYVQNSTVYKPFISNLADLENYNIVPTTIEGHPTFGFKQSRYMCSKDKNAHISAGYENLQAENTITYLNEPDDNNGIVSTSGNTIVNMSELYERAKMDIGIFSQVDYGSFWDCNGKGFRGITYLNKTIDKSYESISNSSFVRTFGMSEQSNMIKNWFFNKNESGAYRDECSLYQLIIKRKDGAYLFLDAFARGHNVNKARSQAFGGIDSIYNNPQKLITVYDCYTFAQYVASCLARIYYRDDSGEAIKMTVLDGLVVCSPYTETWSKDFIVNFIINSPEKSISIQDVCYQSYIKKLLKLMTGDTSIPKCLAIENNFKEQDITIHFVHQLEYNVQQITRQVSNGYALVKQGIASDINVSNVPTDVMKDIMYLDVKTGQLVSDYYNLSWALLTKDDKGYKFTQGSTYKEALSELLQYLSIDKTGIYGELNKSNTSTYYLRQPSSDDDKENNYYGFNGANGINKFSLTS